MEVAKIAAVQIITVAAQCGRLRDMADVAICEPALFAQCIQEAYTIVEQLLYDLVEQIFFDLQAGKYGK